MKTAQGREMSPVPRIDCSTERKGINTRRRIQDWMMKEAQIEVEQNPRKFASWLVKAMRHPLSQSDTDTLTWILWEWQNWPSGPWLEEGK